MSLSRQYPTTVEFQYGRRLREFHGMSSHSHLPHCRVLPLGEFTVTIPEPHATLQSAVTWRNQCHDHATLQGVRIPSAVLKIVFAIFYIFVLMQFRLWRAAAFVSSPIHLFKSETSCKWTVAWLSTAFLMLLSWNHNNNNMVAVMFASFIQTTASHCLRCAGNDMLWHTDLNVITDNIVV